MSADDGIRRGTGLSPATLVALTIAALAAAAFATAATRGFDLTDESYYLLSFRHWSAAPAASFFGAYLSVPAIVLGHSVWALRVFGFALLFGTGVWFARELIAGVGALEGRSRSPDAAAAAIAAGLGVWSYYGAAVGPYMPSYNLLTLASALASSALALRLGRSILHGGARAPLGVAFALGLVAATGIAVKFTAGGLVLLLDLAIVALFAWRRSDVGTGARVVLAIGAGVCVHLAVLVAVDPELVVRFRRAIAIALAMMPRAPLSELAQFALVELPRAVPPAARSLLWPTLFAAVVLVAGPRLGRSSLARAAALVGFVGGSMLVIYVKDNRFNRFVLLTLVAIVVCVALAVLRRHSALPRIPRRSWLLAAVVLVLPFAYGFGTGNALLLQIGMAGVFPTALVVARLDAAAAEGVLARWAVLIGLVFVAALPMEIVVRQWLDGGFTYRLGAPLAAQTAEMPANAAGVRVRMEPRVAAGVADFLALARRSGLEPGQPMVDFTGQSPGLVALSGGVPLGAIWLIGGPAFRGDAAARVALDFVAADDLRKAWFLTSGDSFASIASWPRIVERKLGAVAHDKVGQVRIPDPTSDDKSKTIEVALWRPRR